MKNFVQIKQQFLLQRTAGGYDATHNMIEYLQSQNKLCWWNFCGPQTPAAAGRSHHPHRASTLVPGSRSSQSPPGFGLLDGTGHSTQRMDEAAPSGQFPEASPHPTLWQCRGREDKRITQTRPETRLKTQSPEPQTCWITVRPHPTQNTYSP